MNSKSIIILIVVLLSLSFASAWSTNTFNNSLTIENITFGDPLLFINQTFEIGTASNNGTNYIITENWLHSNFSKYITNWNPSGCTGSGVSTAHVCLYGNTSIEKNMPYSGFITLHVSDAVGGPSYNVSVNNLQLYTSGTHGFYNTFDLSFNRNDLVKVTAYNLTIPTGGLQVVLSDFVEYKQKDRIRYLAIPQNTYVTNAYINLSGYQSSGNNLTALNISINDSVIYYVPTNFTTTNNRTNNFLTQVNSYLSSCAYQGGYCYVPINFYSATNGTLQYSNLLINNNGFTQINMSYNSTTYETAREYFKLNMTYDSYLYSASASLVYGGISYPATRTGTGSNYLFTTSLDAPTVTTATNYSAYWAITLTNSSGSFYYNSSFFNQTVSPIVFALCNSTLSRAYINFTFKDESTLSSLNASTDLATWTYYLGGGTVTKTYLFTNTTVNPAYAYCFSPPDRTLNVNLQYYQYSATGYPQRQYYLSTSLTNATTNQTLYLLGSASGIYTTFIVDNQAFAPISGATIQVYRSFSGVSTLISQGTTDASGISTFWLNPSYDHTIIVSKTGYNTQTLTIRPTQSTYSIMMTSGTGNATYSQYLPGMYWYYYPSQSVLLPNTDYTFGMVMNYSLGGLSSCRIAIANASGDELSTVSGCTGYGGNISLTYNTGNASILYMHYYINTGSGEIRIDPIHYWVEINTTSSSFNTLKNFFLELSQINTEFGGDRLRQSYTKIILFFFLLTIIFASLNIFAQVELYSVHTTILIFWAIIWLFSIGGFFDIPYTSGNTGVWVSTWLTKYAVAILSSCFVAGFFLNKFRRESQ